MKKERLQVTKIIPVLLIIKKVKIFNSYFLNYKNIKNVIFDRYQMYILCFNF